MGGAESKSGLELAEVADNFTIIGSIVRTRKLVSHKTNDRINDSEGIR